MLPSRPLAKCLSTVIVIAAAAISSASTAKAVLLAYEPFDYATGSLYGQGPAFGFSGVWTGGSSPGPTVVSPGLTYSTLPVTGNAASGGGQARNTLTAPLGLASTTGSLYLSFLLNQTSANFANITLFNTAAVAPLDPEIVSWGDVYTGTGFSANYGLHRASGAPGTSPEFVDSGIPINTSGTQFLVMQLDYTTTPGSTVVNLFVNPAIGEFLSGTPNATFTTSSVILFDSLRIENTDGFFIDEIRIGTTYADITAVPEPSTIALTGMALFGSLLFFRSRRRAA